ncbi:MAG: hypothetical protein MHPSP_003791, partial [Paramarteilia canceri]
MLEDKELVKSTREDCYQLIRYTNWKDYIFKMPESYDKFLKNIKSIKEKYSKKN